MNRKAFTLLIVPLALVAETRTVQQAKDEFFETRIRPVLAQQCFACHTSSSMGGLQVDSRAAILRGGNSGPAIVPGDPDKSLLISALRQTSDLKMPKGGRLTDAQIADFATWVKDGAVWPAEQGIAKAGPGYRITAAQRSFWSLQPVAHEDPPQVNERAWAKSDIDRFILARLEKEGLKPAPLADRRTLIRRLTYDITGLPPPLEEVRAFEADKSPNAYEKVVDRLLASPHYGETWARHWLDVVRYGEDDYRLAKKPDRIEPYTFAYTYRDWVIQSLNDDMSYDLFVKSQLAGDQLDESIRAKTIPGLGMNGLGVWQFVDNPPAIERSDEWNDKVDVTTKAFLGLTVGCARCHDHKYDPIPTKDYYSLASVFASSSYHAYPLAPQKQVEEYDSRKSALEEKEKALKAFVDQAQSMLARTLFVETEDYMLAAWKVANNKNATVTGVADAGRLDSEMLDRWIRFLQKRPANYSYLEQWQAMMARHGSEDQARKLAHEFYLQAVQIDQLHEQLKEENQLALDKLKDPNEKFDPLPNGLKRKLNPHQIALKGLDREQMYLWRDMFEEDLSEAPDTPDAKDGVPSPGLFKFEGYGLEKRLSSGFAAYIAKQRAEIEEAKQGLKPYPFVYGLADKSEPVDLKVFLRGSPYSLGDPAPRGFLSVLSTGEPERFSKGSGRLELAEAIVKSPIAARVIVNRIWRWNMGTGLVETPSNFGLMGERPSDPELLEYLTARFISEGMSWKKLIKEIVMSRTYQSSTEPIAENLTKDPDNRLYWRANRRRLEAEGIWDSLLTAAGKLDLTKIGGPSQDLAAGMTRRGAYGKVSRVFPNAFQVAFDFPTATLSAERRYITTVPQQRLFFLNSPFVSAAAGEMADRIKDSSDPAAQIRRAFQIAYQRDPTADEQGLMIQFLHRESSQPGAAQSRLQAMCWALLSSDEFLYID